MKKYENENMKKCEKYENGGSLLGSLFGGILGPDLGSVLDPDMGPLIVY